MPLIRLKSNDAGRPTEAELAAARRLFEDGSAAIWRAVRAGFRGNFPENFGTTFLTSERRRFCYSVWH